MIAMSDQGSLYFLVCLQLKPRDWPHPCPTPTLTCSRAQFRSGKTSEQGFEVPLVPPRGLPGHKQTTWCSRFQQALHTLMALTLPLIRSRLPAVPPRLPGQGNQVTCYDLSQRGGAGEQVLP